VHGSHSATGIYRKNLGIAMALGEQIRVSDWAAPFSVAWSSFRDCAIRIINTTEGTVSTFIDQDGVANIGRLVSAIENDA
jgi:hypothetical protein